MDELQLWRPVVGQEGRYEVSRDGLVRSLLSPGGRVLSQYGGHRYLRVSISGKGPTSVHTLVCAAFHGPRPTPTHDVRHLDGDAHDNRAANLAWGTKSQNSLDRADHGHDPHANRTHCKHGHEYTPANTHYRGRGRVCRRCRMIRKAASRARHAVGNA